MNTDDNKSETDVDKSISNEEPKIQLPEPEASPTEQNTIENIEIVEPSTDELNPNLPADNTVHVFGRAEAGQPSGNLTPKKNLLQRIFQPQLIFPKSLREKLGKSAIPVASLIILLLMGGIAYGAVSIIHKQGNNSGKAELAIAPIKPFQVVSTIPSSGEKNVQDSSKITINFNQPVNANKLQDAFIVSPTIKGSVAQGSSDNQIIFTPNVPFKDSTIVKIMIDNSFQSQLGHKLSSDYLLGFTTQTPTTGVEFQYQDDMVNLVSAQSNTNVQLTLNVGTQVDPDGQITVYKASINPLLGSLQYTIASSNGYSYDNPTYDSIDTTGMQQITSSTGLKDQATFNVNEPDGIYLVAANSGGKQIGWTWVVFNDNGTVMRQDYQKIVLSTFNLTDNSIPSDTNVTFYNLDNGVQILKTATLQSPESFNFPSSQQVDVAVVTAGQDTMVVPISVPNSLADARVGGDLSQVRNFYAVTDKPAYKVNDTLKFAGYVTIDNDAQFTQDQENSVQLFVASQDNPTDHLEDFTVPVGNNGAFSGQFTVSSAFSGQQDLAIYGYQDMADQTPISIATFAVTSEPSSYTVNVAFNKTDYLANDTVDATLTVTQSNGQPLTNTPITYNVYAKPYYENNPSENLDSFGSTGNQVGNENQTAQLNSKGQAVVTVDMSQLQLLTQGSQVVTVQATKTDPSGVVASGGASAIVHQGNMIITFGIGKSYYSPNDQRVARIYVTDLNGKPLANTKVNYQFVTYTWNDTTQEDDPSILASGSGTTDGNGYLQISQQLNTSDSVTIVVSALDSSGNEVEAEQYTGTNTDSTPVMAGADNLDYLDVSGSSGEVNVGDQVPLTITSPQNLNVLVSYERGLVYTYKTLQLTKGTNTYTLDVTPQLAPSFNLVFSYFVDGMYHTEGTAFTVNNPQQKLNLNISPNQTTYSANQTATITINSTNSNGQGVPANLIVGVESDSMFNLGTSFEPDMYTYYYATREYSTNSSSSLTGIGSGGGKCGGGGFYNSGLVSNSGTTLYWNPNLNTNNSGIATIKVPLQVGKWHILVYAMGSSADVGSVQTTIVSQ